MTRITGAYVLVTNRCNFDCAYCYEKDRSGVMTWDTMKALIDMLDAQWEPGHHASQHCDLSLTMFGGEPLLNWPIVQQTFEYIDSKRAKFGITILTNGSVWTPEIHEYLKEQKKKLGCRLLMQVSLDGCEDSHNSLRRFLGGKFSFDTVIKNIQRYREIFPDLILRETVVPERISSLFYDYETLSKLSDNVSLTPIIEGAWYDALSTAKEVLPKIYDLYMEQIKTRPNMFLSLLTGCIRRSCEADHCSYLGCHAGKELIGVTVNGDIYPCHRFIAYRDKFDFKMGDVFSGIDRTSDRAKEIEAIHSENDQCNLCPGKTCNRCYATNMFLEGELGAIPTNGYCEFCRINQTIVDQYADRIVEAQPHALKEWSLYKSPNTTRRALQMCDGKKLLSDDVEDLMLQTMTQMLMSMKMLQEQNQTICNTLSALLKLQGEHAAAHEDTVR